MPGFMLPFSVAKVHTMWMVAYSMVCVEEVKMEFLRKRTKTRNILATCLHSLHDIKLQYRSIFMLMSVYWGMRRVCGMHICTHNTTEEKGSFADNKDFVVCMNDRKLFTCRSRWVKCIDQHFQTNFWEFICLCNAWLYF